MAIIKAVASHAPITTVIDYVEKNEKTESRLMSGIGVSPETAKEEMQATKEIHGKTGGRTYLHYVQSFAPGENITPEEAHKIAKEFAETFPTFKGYEVLIATHKDRDHIHTHFVVNSVSYETGRKFQLPPQKLQEMKDHSDKICKAHGLSICEKNRTFDGHERKGITAWTKEKYQFLQQMVSKKTDKSYVYHTMEAVKFSAQRATSKEEFCNILSEKGYSVDWQDRHKHITFSTTIKDEKGNDKVVKVRDTNLNKTFNLEIGKDELLRKFDSNAEASEIETYSHYKCEGVAARYRISRYKEAKNELAKEFNDRKKLLQPMDQKLIAAKNTIDFSNERISEYKSELKNCSKLQFMKRHDLEEKIEHQKALIESTKENRTVYLNKNGFESLKDFNEYRKDTIQINEAIKELTQKIQDEQNTFQIYRDSFDKGNVKPENIVIRDDDLIELRDTLRGEFGEPITDKDIRVAEKQFNDDNNGEKKSVLKQLDKNKAEIKGQDQSKSLDMDDEIEHNHHSHDRGR